MIFTYRDYNITQDQMQDIINKIWDYIKPEDLRLASQRDWEYALPIYLADFNSNDIILDIGCGMSYNFLYLSSIVEKFFGIDDIKNGCFDKWTVDWLKTLTHYDEYINRKAQFLNMNAKELPFKDNYFTKIITWSALEHFMGNDDILCAKEIYRCLKPGGIFLGSVDFNADSEYPIPDNPDCRFYTHQSFLDRIVEPSGFELVGKDYIKYGDPINMQTAIAISLFFMLRKTL